VEVFATTDGTIPEDATPIGTTTNANGKLAPGALVKVAVSVTLPTPSTSTAYTLVARITQSADADTSNNNQTVATVTATGSNFLGLLLTTYQFTETTFNPVGFPQITSGGTLKDINGADVEGGYFYNVFNGPISTPGLLTIVGPGGSTLFNLDFKGAQPNSLNGRTITFQKSSAGSSGSVLVIANPAAGIPSDLNLFFKLV
jgi:hypothetical protein